MTEPVADREVRVRVAASGIGVPRMIAWPLMTAGLVALVGLAYYLGQQTVPPHIASVGPRIEDVRRIAKLAVLRVQVADVIEGRNLGGQGVLLVRGDADMTIDLDGIEITHRDDERRTATLALPQPRPDRPRVDQDRTRVYELRKTGLAALNPFADPRAELLADCMRAAQESVEKAVQDPDFVTQARRQADLLLVGFYRQVGWEIALEWHP
jgi:hypothetical protein